MSVHYPCSLVDGEAKKAPPTQESKQKQFESKRSVRWSQDTKHLHREGVQRWLLVYSHVLLQIMCRPWADEPCNSWYEFQAQPPNKLTKCCVFASWLDCLRPS